MQLMDSAIKYMLLGDIIMMLQSLSHNLLMQISQSHLKSFLLVKLLRFSFKVGIVLKIIIS